MNNFQIALMNSLSRHPPVKVVELSNSFYRATACLRENAVAGMAETPEEAIARARRLCGGAGVLL